MIVWMKCEKRVCLETCSSSRIKVH